MFDKVLIANRAEIAVRVARTCREMGIATVGVYSDVDANSKHVAAADEAVALPGVVPADTYLDIEAILAAATQTGSDAIHPGYGFLSENADFADLVVAAGLTWIGPPPAALRLLGNKVDARRVAVSADVPVVPGTPDAVTGADEVLTFASEHGYPIAVKAAGGGGGRGLRVARSADEIENALESARREAEAYFGSPDVFVERYLENPKHLEVQILAPRAGVAHALGVRDCSLQRRHQKLVEETPAGYARSDEMSEAAAELAAAAGYVNAGTCEFLADDAGFYFLEVNARLQVEHTVTEEVLGIDLVAQQLRIAAGEADSDPDVEPRGHAIECRINAEDPARGFIPTPGRITRYIEPAGLGVRVDSGYRAGDEIPAAYDSLVAKLVTTGANRDEARRRMLRALKEFEIEGVATTIPAHLLLLEHPDFVAGTHSTTTVERIEFGADEAEGEGTADVLLVGGRGVRLWSPAMSASATSAVHDASAGGGDVVAPMQGTVLVVLVADGAQVAAGEALVVLEAMKMETTISSPGSGKVTGLSVRPGATVAAGEVLLTVE